MDAEIVVGFHNIWWIVTGVCFIGGLVLGGYLTQNMHLGIRIIAVIIFAVLCFYGGFILFPTFIFLIHFIISIFF